MPRLLLALAVAAFAVLPARAGSEPGRSGAVPAGDSNRPLIQLKREAKAEELPAVDQPSAAPAAPAVPAARADQRYWVVVRAMTRDQRTAIAGAGMSIEEIGSNQVAGVAHIKTIQKLKALGFEILFQTSLARYTKDFPPQDKAYHDYKRMLEALQSLAKANPKLVSMFSIGRTWQGRDIWCARFNTTESGAKPSQKPGAVFVGNHHAREHLSVEIPLKLAEHLAAKQNDPAVRKLLESRDIYVIPMLNADGAEYDISTGEYKWQRKNMRVNPDQEIGVDLNRNYDFLFGGEGSSGDTYSDTYHGPSAFSEPETQAFKAFLEARPNVKTLQSYHSYSSLILYPWGGKDSPVEDAQDLKAYKVMAAAMAKMTGYTAEQSSDLYVATGDCTDWTYAALKIFSFTTELYPSYGNGGFYPGAAAIDKEAPGNIKAALYLVEYSDDPHRAAAATR